MVLKKRNKNFVIMIYLFFILTFFISIFLNLNEVKEKFSEGNSIQLELLENLSRDEIENLEKELLKLGDIKKIKYNSKERALSNLVKELQISIPEASNPLPNSFILTLVEGGDYKGVISKLEERREIASFHLNEEKIEKNMIQLKEINGILRALAIIFLIPTVFTIVMSHRGMCHDNYIYFYFTTKNREQVSSKAKKVTFLPILSAGVMGGFSFLNLYIFLKNSNIFYIHEFFQLTAEYVAIISIGSILFLIILLFLIPFKVKNPQKEGIS